MKKINLKNLSTDEVLTKNELKKIIGGDGSGCQDWLCYCPGQGTWGASTCDPWEVEAMFSAIEASCPWGGGCSMM